MNVIYGSLAGLVVAAPIAAAGIQTGGGGEPPSLTASQTSRVILRDDFNSGEWGEGWRGEWVQDRNLRVYCEDGRLRVKGISGDPVPVCADHHEFRFTGLVSKQSADRDVVLACKMQVLTPLPNGKTRVRYLVHLCGAQPDYFFDTGMAHEPDGREGWLHVPIAHGFPFSHDHDYPYVSFEEIPFGGEHTVVVEHDAETKLTRGYVVDGGGWHPLGEYRAYLATTQVELKVDVPYDGVEVDVAYNDVRIYARPQNAPVRFVVIRPPFPGFPFADLDVVFRDESGATIAEGKTDRDGEAALLFPSDRLYPMGGEAEFSLNGESIGLARIESHGVDGLYPGDIWKIDVPERFRVEGEGYPMGM